MASPRPRTRAALASVHVEVQVGVQVDGHACSPKGFSARKGGALLDVVDGGGEGLARLSRGGPR
jgi:hypothetical protein